MGTTTVETADVRGIEQELNALLLNGRAALPHGLNGRPPAPSPRVASLRKAINQGMCRPLLHLYEISAADVDANVPWSEVKAPYDRLLRLLELRYEERVLRRRDYPVPTLMQRTMKEANELSLAMLKLADSPESKAAHEAVLREAADLPPVLADLTTSVERRMVSTHRMEISR